MQILCNKTNTLFLHLTNKRASNVKIGVMVKLSTPIINVMIKSCNTIKKSLRKALLYLTNKASLNVEIGVMVKLNSK